MKIYFKHLFIRANIENIDINKVLVDGGVTINLMHRSVMHNIGKVDINFRPHNMVLSNYGGKIGTTMGVI